MGYYCGIDIGASAAKLVIVDDAGQIAARALRRSGVDYAQTARACLDEALELGGLAESQLAGVFSTGYGRDNVPFAGGKMTEIACHGKGAFQAFRRAMTVIDIGAQDCKVIHLDQQGRRTSFKMNRKCAAGTGAFLEEIAYRLNLAPDELNGLAERSTSEVSLGSFCTV
ncbi:MAG: acyl-CoA dehydratase activase, partial [Patescibacteria group bacterium]|nr:acyl-CoA dehydratase activase [Patescibacteria group bacterium]